ncbi:MAG: macro domain-containing protein [Gemmatimonadota bacterium]
MIHVVISQLSAALQEGVVRPIRSDLAPVSPGARDLGQQAGPEVEERLRQGGRLPVGGAVITPGGALGAVFLIHVVTCSEDEPQSALSVQRALRNGLRRARDWGLKSLALPPLGIGVGTMDAEDAARAQVEILVNHIDEGHPPLDLTIVVANAYEEEIFSRLAGELMGERFPMRN